MALPLASFHILLSLVDGERHGYVIMKDVEAQGLAMGPGTLYTAIGKLLAAGLILETVERDDESDQRRRYYRLTPAGLKALRAEADRLTKLAQTVRRRLRTLMPARVP